MRWIRSRSISELIIAPMARSLLAKTLPPAEEGGAAEAALTVLGGSRVEAVTLDAAGKVSGLSYPLTLTLPLPLPLTPTLTPTLTR